MPLARTSRWGLQVSLQHQFCSNTASSGFGRAVDHDHVVTHGRSDSSIRVKSGADHDERLSYRTSCYPSWTLPGASSALECLVLKRVSLNSLMSSELISMCVRVRRSEQRTSSRATLLRAGIPCLTIAQSER